MGVLIIVDPAYHKRESSTASIYLDKDGLRLTCVTERKFNGDLLETARWCISLKAQYPNAVLKIDDAGPGAAIIEYIEKMHPSVAETVPIGRR